MPISAISARCDGYERDFVNLKAESARQGRPRIRCGPDNIIQALCSERPADCHMGMEFKCFFLGKMARVQFRVKTPEFPAAAANFQVQDAAAGKHSDAA